MRLGEALTRCPGLRLVPPDPDGVRELWNVLLDRLEGIGAAVESDRPGQAFFEAGGMMGIHGGHLEGVLPPPAGTRDVTAAAPAAARGSGPRPAASAPTRRPCERGPGGGGPRWWAPGR